jgi:outer membrane receptor protein involved in Fe transport
MTSAEAAGLVIPPPVPTPGVFASGYGAGAFCSQSQTAFNASLPASMQGHYTISSGIPVNLDGNKMPTTPDWTIGLGVQYTFVFESGYSLVPRVDFYWKDSMFGRIFNGPADRISSSENTNLQIQLNAPDDRWYARAWVQNVFDEDNVTGMYVTDASSGLFTNVFVNDPRLFGITLGARF